MRRLLLVLGVVWVAVTIPNRAAAQTGDTMPGTVVSNTVGQHLPIIGREQPEVGKKVGKPINLPTGNMMRPYNPANPYEQFQGTSLSPNSVVAPVNGYSSAVAPNLFEQTIDQFKSLVGLNTKPTITRIYTPGIFRRDRERVQERMWVRD